MLNKIIEQQLSKVRTADLGTYNTETNTYFIRKKGGIKLEENNGYIIRLKDSAFTNTILINNWNHGSSPKTNCLKIDVTRKMDNMIKVISVGYDLTLKQDLDKYWSGWLSIDNIEIIQKL